MANNYTLFSAELRAETREEKDWLEWAVQDLDDLNSGEREAWMKEFRDLLPDNILDDYCWYWPGFCAEVGESGLWAYSMESGDVEMVVALVQMFLAKFRPTGHWTMEWANTCSRPRAGEFGGGAVFVTADKVRWMCTSTWLHEQRRDK